MMWRVEPQNGHQALYISSHHLHRGDFRFLTYFITLKDDPMTNKMVERITRSFESQSMMKTLGAMIYKVEKGNVIIEAPFLPSTLQQQGYVHAGLTFSIGDSAAGYSALT